jgi:hypothetical protein
MQTLRGRMCMYVLLSKDITVQNIEPSGWFRNQHCICMCVYTHVHIFPSHTCTHTLTHSWDIRNYLFSHACELVSAYTFRHTHTHLFSNDCELIVGAYRPHTHLYMNVQYTHGIHIGICMRIYCRCTNLL